MHFKYSFYNSENFAIRHASSPECAELDLVYCVYNIDIRGNMPHIVNNACDIIINVILFYF